MLVLLLAVALVPTGFTEQPALSSRAAYVAGKPVTVYCADNYTAWASYVRLTYGSGFTAEDIDGAASAVGGDAMYLNADGCSVLGQKLKGGRLDAVGLGHYLLILAHEAEHLAGHSDEGDTDCAALAVLPDFLRHSWGVKKAANIGRIMAAALEAHARKPPAYRGSCG